MFNRCQYKQRARAAMKHTLSVRWRQLLLTVRLCHHLSHACSVSEWPVDSQTFRASFCTSCTVSPGVVITRYSHHTGPTRPSSRSCRDSWHDCSSCTGSGVRLFGVAAHVKMRDDGWMGLLRCLATNVMWQCMRCVIYYRCCRTRSNHCVTFTEKPKNIVFILLLPCMQATIL